MVTIMHQEHYLLKYTLKQSMIFEVLAGIHTKGSLASISEAAVCACLSIKSTCALKNPSIFAHFIVV